MKAYIIIVIFVMANAAHGDSCTIPRMMHINRIVHFSVTATPVDESLNEFSKAIRKDNGPDMLTSVVLWDPKKLLKNVRVTTEMRDLTEKQAFDKLCAAANLEFIVEEYAILVFPAGSGKALREASKRITNKTEKMDIRIIIPKLEFKNRNIVSVINAVRGESRRVNATGRKFVIEFGTGDWKRVDGISAWLYNQPVRNAIGYICLAGSLDLEHPREDVCVISVPPK